VRQSTRTRLATDAASTQTRALIASGNRRGTWRSQVFHALILSAIVIAIVTLGALIVHAIYKGYPRLDLNLITNFPSTLDRSTSGMQSAIVGTIFVMAGVVVTVVPLGLSAAIYLEEYAGHDRWYNRLIELNIQNLAAVPSIVFGILGLAFIVRGPLGLGFVAFAGSLTLTMMVLPTVILAAREAIRAVPPSIRDASLALGATKWQTIRRQILPASIPGVATGTILALSRAIGETAPLLLVGATTFVLYNPDSPFEGSYTALPVQIFNWATRPQEDFRVLAAAAIILLLAVLLLMNSFAIWLRNRFETKW
jgi:phosphate transport system permease protein